MTQSLSNLPTDMGMAFVLIQQLAPDRESLLSEILNRVTSLPVREVENGVSVEPNHVYVIPPIPLTSQLNSVTIVGDGDRLQQVLWNLLSYRLKESGL